MHWERLMRTIYENYDERFVYQAPDLYNTTGRRGWAEDSPAFQDSRSQEYEPRFYDVEEQQEAEVEEGLDESHDD